MRSYRYLDALTTSFVVILLVSNLLAQKVVRFGPFAASGALILFPITYIFADVFTEVYGYAASRRAIWLAFFGTALLWAMSALILALPADPSWHNQQAFVTVFNFLPRLMAASLIAFWCGEFANSYTLARMKVLTRGRHLWSRTISSTVVGQAVDTTLVVVLTFAGTVSMRTLISMAATSYLAKVVYEVLATPLTYVVVGALKRAEAVDHFDRHTNFNPFRFTDHRDA